MRRVTDAERRARLVARHHLGRTADDVEEAVHAVVALHSSDPATPYLGAWARTRGFAVDQLERALYDDRTLWRLHAMRRTLFVVHVDDAPVVMAAASRDVAAGERRRLLGWLADDPPAADLEAWVERVEAKALAAIGDAERGTSELGELVPELTHRITVGSGKWTTEVPLGSRLLFVMAMDGRLVRARTAGSWRASQYRWAETERWFGSLPSLPPAEAARAELARRYLGSHGPATVTDLKWWTGWTVARTRAAIAAVGAVPVELETGEEAFVLPDDQDGPDTAPEVVSLLPGLDPAPMGWKERGWFLGPHAGELFDRNGNVGPTVWVGGRIVGGWGQRSDGEVAVRLLEPVDDEAAGRIEAEAAALAAWLDGTVVVPRFRTPLERELTS